MSVKKEKSNNWIIFVVLHILLLVYSMGGICSKLASQCHFLDFKFILYYGIMIFILMIYAVVWQQIIKKLPLTLAFANKAITIVWGVVWGKVFFGEDLSIIKILGVALVIIGVVIFSLSDGKKKEIISE